MIVYPHPLPVQEMVLGGGSGRQNAEVRAAGNIGENADFHSIRPYVQGDDLRRVHWKSTAHTGKLAIKEYEYRSSGAVTVIVDLQQGIHFGHDEFSTLEIAITVASSLLNYVLSTGNRAGLFTTGAKIIAFSPESGQRQLHRALETLALAKDDGRTSLAQVLASDEIAQSGRATTIVITSSTDTAIIGPLLHLHGRSAHVLLVLVNAQSFMEAEEEEARDGENLWSFATRSLNVRDTILALTNAAPHVPSDEEHKTLLHAAMAAGIDVFSINANVPLHQALQGLRALF